MYITLPDCINHYIPDPHIPLSSVDTIQLSQTDPEQQFVPEMLEKQLAHVLKSEGGMGVLHTIEKYQIIILHLVKRHEVGVLVCQDDHVLALVVPRTGSQDIARSTSLRCRYQEQWSGIVICKRAIVVQSPPRDKSRERCISCSSRGVKCCSRGRED